MTHSLIYDCTECLKIAASGKDIILVHLLDKNGFESFVNTASPLIRRQIEQGGFSAKDRQICILRNESGAVDSVLCGVIFPLSIYSTAVVAERLRADFSADFLKAVEFKIATPLSPDEATQAAISWALTGYKFDAYKKDRTRALPQLIAPEGTNFQRVEAMTEGLCLVRTLINTPANHMGTDDLANAAQQIATLHQASFKKSVDKELLEQNFPMIYAVGKASPRRPQLVEINWGNDSHPRVTLVGKGVVFDTGGLDLKPAAFMAMMKKDMGGAAHVLGLAAIIMTLQLPIRLRVLLAIAENSVGGESFRPGDVLNSRKGLSVEIGDTDAEGRLVVSDALTYACEGPHKPDLLVDFCTLTGAARVALGYDIPALFSNNDHVAEAIKSAGLSCDDPVWPLPLWQPYLKEMNSQIADLNNIGTGKAGAIHGALFMQQFIDPSVDWVHLDCYAWEQTGKPGRPVGGADTGLRAVLAYIEQRFKR